MCLRSHSEFMGGEELGPLACGHSSFFGTKLRETLPDGVTEETEAPPPYLGPGWGSGLMSLQELWALERHRFVGPWLRPQPQAEG